MNTLERPAPYIERATPGVDKNEPRAESWVQKESGYFCRLYFTVLPYEHPAQLIGEVLMPPSHPYYKRMDEMVEEGTSHLIKGGLLSAYVVERAAKAYRSLRFDACSLERSNVLKDPMKAWAVMRRQVNELAYQLHTINVRGQ